MDSAIKSLNNLHLKAVKVKLPSALGGSVPESEPSIEPPNEGMETKSNLQKQTWISGFFFRTFLTLVVFV